MRRRILCVSLWECASDAKECARCRKLWWVSHTKGPKFGPKFVSLTVRYRVVLRQQNGVYED